MKLLDVKASIMTRAYETFHNAYFFYILEKILDECNVNKDIFQLRKARYKIIEKLNYDIIYKTWRKKIKSY